MESYTGEEVMEYMQLKNKRDHHWRMVFKENDGGVGDYKVILHSKRWYV